MFNDEPPPYERIVGGEMQVETNVDVSGRFEVDLDSKVCEAVANLIPFPSEEDLHHPPPTSPVPEWRGEIKLNIVIQVVGSRGDVQPFIALGNQLQKHGHRVRLATHNSFDTFVRDSGLEFYPIGGDPAELMAYMVKNPGLIPQMKSLRAGDVQKKRTMVAEMLNGCWRSCIEDDPISKTPFVANAIIANPPSFAHVHCAQALGIPVHLMFTMPWSSTKAFPHPLANLKYSHTSQPIANYLSYGIVEWMTWQGLGDVINKWRSEIDLEPVPSTEGPRLAETLKIPFTYCWSPALMPKPSDWPSHIDVCGFFFREPPAYAPPPDFAAFLRNGPRPVYIGFGSIVIDDPGKFTATILEAVGAAGTRAVISRGWSKLGGAPSSNIFYIDDCPHEWLFQRVSAVVHHGGAGTTACGLRHGCPTAIIPFFGDQPFWGNMVAASGAGPRPIPYRDVNAQNLADAISVCLQPSTLAAAQDMALRMQSESGVQAAVASFHRHLPLAKMECQILPDQPAVWEFRKSFSDPVYMSNIAAQILLDSKRIDQKHLHLLVLPLPRYQAKCNSTGHKADLDFSRSHNVKPIIIDNRRWDPLTGTTSATLATSANMLKHGTDVFYKPIKVVQRGYSESLRPGTPQFESSLTTDGRLPGGQSEKDQNTLSQRPRTDGGTTCAVLAASGKSLGKFVGYAYKGAIVDIPLATTEGLRAVPRLYGEDVRDLGPVQDWKSGIAVGGRSFAYGVAGGLTDIFVQPYKGGQDEGAIGAAKGLAKGTIGTVTKLGSGMLGLVAYPGQGICRSLQTAGRSRTRKRIIEARERERASVARRAIDMGIDQKAIARTFDRVKRGKGESLRGEL